MPDIVTIAPAIQRLISFVFPPLLRGIYTKKKLDEYLRIEIPSSTEGFTYSTYTQEVRCTLAVTNTSPFLLIIDRLELLATFDGGTVSCFHIIPTEIESGMESLIFVRGRSYIPPDAIQFVKKNAKDIHLDISAYISSRVHCFTTKRRKDYVENVAFH